MKISRRPFYLIIATSALAHRKDIAYYADQRGAFHDGIGTVRTMLVP
jgi:hypothetical protein